MSSSDQAIESERPRTDAIGIGHLPTSVTAAFRAALSAPMQSMTDAIVETSRGASSAIYGVSNASEADRQIQRLNSMRNVDRGWDGRHAEPPNTVSLNAAIDFINRLRHLPIPTPMASVASDGNAGLFWSDTKLYADVELMEDGRIGYYVRTNDGSSRDNEEDMPKIGLPSILLAALAKAYLANR